MKARRRDSVVILRDGGFTHPQHDRVYVRYVGGRIFTASPDQEGSTRFRRADAEAMIDRGRWHGLNPTIKTLRS